MIDLKADIQPVTDFRNNSVAVIKRLKATGRPIVLTVNGRSEVVIQDAAAYQRLLDLAAHADVEESIRQGREDVTAGRTTSFKDVAKRLRKSNALGR